MARRNIFQTHSKPNQTKIMKSFSNLEELKSVLKLNYLPKIRVASFDVFDTVIFRDTILPEGVFWKTAEEISREGILLESLAIQFPYIRKQMELKASNEKHGQEVTLDDIYDQFARFYDFGSEQRRHLMDLELKREWESAQPN